MHSDGVRSATGVSKVGELWFKGGKARQQMDTNGFLKETFCFLAIAQSKS